MKNQSFLLSISLFIVLLIGSCSQEGGLFGEETRIEGCTDPKSFNYNPDAKP